ncbi:transposase, IS4 family protein [Rhodovulum sulfidophilum]|uniref:Transposase, IS4 family protein n=1 Tax=Rhodovulum sulfidophilum TaxID=35806 RepID=A0A0D6B044_RHOSU|nr:transposase, IS4 family protein [Rhodovulum sulfidophilum]
MKRCGPPRDGRPADTVRGYRPVGSTLAGLPQCRGPKDIGEEVRKLGLGTIRSGRRFRNWRRQPPDELVSEQVVQFQHRRQCDLGWPSGCMVEMEFRHLIAGRKQRKIPVRYDKRRYKRRNRIEIMFGRLKD